MKFSKRVKSLFWSGLVLLLVPLTACLDTEGNGNLTRVPLQSFIPPIMPTDTPIPTPTPTLHPPLVPATPAADTNDYQLKQWTEEQVIALFQEARQAIKRYHIPLSQQEAFTHYAINIGREIFVLYPHLRAQEVIYWSWVQIPTSSNILWDYPVADFVTALETALNLGQVQPRDLEAWLPGHGFSLNASLDAANIFGDGEPAMLLHIESGPIKSKSSIMLLTGKATGDYRLYSLEETWRVNCVISVCHQYEFAISDHNRNGLPEIIIDRLEEGRTYCESGLEVYEWQAGEFITLIPRLEYHSGRNRSDCEGVFQFHTNVDGRADTILKTIRYENLICPETGQNLSIQIRYEWEGAAYVEAQDQDVLPYDQTQPPQCGVGWAYFAPTEMAIPVMESALPEWEPSADNPFGPDAKDFMGFQLGTWYAFDGQVDAAVTALQALSEGPAQTDNETLRAFAADFLSQYNTRPDLFAACQAVIEYAESSLEEGPGRYAKTQDVIDWWGFVGARGGGSTTMSNICSRSAALEVSLQHIEVASEAELLSQLSEHQIPYQETISREDLSEDGHPDLLIIVANHAYALLSNPLGTLRPVKVYEAVYNPTLSQHQLPGNGGILNILEIDYGEKPRFALVPFQFEGYELREYGHVYPAPSDYKVISGDDQLLIVRSSLEPGTEGYVDYAWNSQALEFEAILYTRDPSIMKLVTQVEALLFEQSDSTAAIQLLLDMLADETEYIVYHQPLKDYLLYLLGLAYELNSEDSRAVETYLALWKQYPDSPYTLAARRKLELVPPETDDLK